MAELQRTKTYGYDGLTGWKSYRALRPGKGMYHDVQRRLPYYWSDIVDGFTYRTFAGTVRIYFVNLLPALAFILDMERRTNGFYSVNEALLSSALAALVFSTLSCQPITIVGITGLISLFNYTIYDIVKQYDVSVYPQVMAWTGIWGAIFHWLFAICNTSDYMRYVTDFSSQGFGMYVGIIYMIKGVEEAVALFDFGMAEGFLSIVIAILFCLTVYYLELLGKSKMWQPTYRTLIADYAYPIATIFWTGFSHIPGRLKNAGVPDLPKNKAFYPSDHHLGHTTWYIDFWNLEGKWICAAIPFGFLTMLLFFYDHNISSITAQAKHFPLKKPGGFHWDFFLLGWTTLIGGIMGFPFPNGLVPQAPVHTDALTTYETGVKKLKTDDRDPISFPQPEVKAVKVEEQRISHFIMCLALVGTMTGPLLTVLATIPRALFVGVFFVVGWGGIGSNLITQKLLFIMREHRFVPRDEPLLNVSKRKILHFVSWQILVVAACVAISQTIAAIGFPILIFLLIPIRWFWFPKWFTVEELSCMDALTADSSVVLASLGGAPELPEVKQRRLEGEDVPEEKDDEKDVEANDVHSTDDSEDSKTKTS